MQRSPRIIALLLLPLFLAGVLVVEGQDPDHVLSITSGSVFQTIELVNATVHSYRNFDLWVNQRYVLHVDELLAGETIRLSLWDFFDERGDRFNAGGFWATREPERVRLVEMQPAQNLPMVGLLTIRSAGED